MNLTKLRGTVEFWNRFAPWYEKWLSRGAYHMPLTRELSSMIEPGWRILDIGAGTGALSIPLAALGCRVTALEPSPGMRDFFSGKLLSFGIEAVKILPRRWEDFPVEEGKGFDLIVACNSLHLTSGGIAGGMEKVFGSGAAYVALMTEINQGLFIDFKEIDALQDAYDFMAIKHHRVDSSFYFESMDEVLDLEEALDRTLQAEIVEGKPVQRDSAEVAVLWWERKGG